MRNFFFFKAQFLGTLIFRSGSPHTKDGIPKKKRDSHYGFDLNGRSLLNHDRDDERQRRLDEAAVKSAAFKVKAAANATAAAEATTMATPAIKKSIGRPPKVTRHREGVNRYT